MDSIFHDIKAYLYANPFGDDEYTARVSVYRTMSVRDICDSAARRGGSTVSADAMEFAVEQFLKEMNYCLCDGCGVNTGSFIAAPVIRGVFSHQAEKFDEDRHRLIFDFRQGKTLSDAARKVRVSVAGLARSGTRIYEVIDVKTGSVNHLITPGHNLRIRGAKLKLMGDDPANGIYFIAQGDGTRYKVEAADVIRNMPKELLLMAPELPNGEYQVEVVTQFTRGKFRIEPYYCLFDQILTV